MEPSTGRHNDIGGVPSGRTWIPLKDRETVLMMHEIAVDCINVTEPVVDWCLQQFVASKMQRAALHWERLAGFHLH